jgi:rare lipoprotein A
LLTGCGGAPKQVRGVGSDQVAGAKPRAEPKARYGNMRSYVVFGKTYYPKQSSRGYVERGIASWYGPKFHGKKTSSGEIYDMHQMTAAHKTLPLPTYALVTNLENGRNPSSRSTTAVPSSAIASSTCPTPRPRSSASTSKGTAMVQVTPSIPATTTARCRRASA